MNYMTPILPIRPYVDFQCTFILVRAIQKYVNLTKYLKQE